MAVSLFSVARTGDKHLKSEHARCSEPLERLKNIRVFRSLLPGNSQLLSLPQQKISIEPLQCIKNELCRINLGFSRNVRHYDAVNCLMKYILLTILTGQCTLQNISS